ncbi:acyltransferase family-domain-containing protein [Plectosphaerella cucumerina]|uniref:Acyltransferase family-domain-containing protein n=1 Tax=Plectosphaerella cucumerina TaxID=40658 RepID=A0A8K0TQH9_9PEZI|nr:acyltransferase family-domain-containing protein [Plectosphaerella cucumerina]
MADPRIEKQNTGRQSEGCDHEEHFSPFTATSWRAGLALLLGPYIRTRSYTHLVRIFTVNLYHIIVPSFLQPPSDKAAAESHRPDVGSINTEWLDGLRGVAAFCVCISHFSSHGHPGIRWGYGADKDRHSFFELPIIRLIVAGRAMVCLFFVISGYALAFSTLKSIHRHDFDGLHRRLPSSVFRRAIRLTVPSFASSFTVYLAQRLGLVVRPGHASSFWKDTRALLAEFDFNMNLFDWEDHHGKAFYGTYLWTIPVELRASFILFVTVLGLSRTRASVRIVTLAGLFVYCMSKTRWDIALFMAGILIADCSLISHSVYSALEESELPGGDRRRTSSPMWYTLRQKPNTRLLCTLGWVFVLVAGLWIASYPIHGAKTSPFWKCFYTNGPDGKEFQTRFWPSLGAVMIVAAISQMPPCQAVLETEPVLYLGRISYALYLYHGLVRMIIGVPLADFLWATFGKKDFLVREGLWFISFVIAMAITIWVSDIAWRLVDIPSVRLARWVETKCSLSIEEKRLPRRIE